MHDYAKYGYKEERLQGLKKWYEDYMNQSIKTEDGYIGLDKKVYSLKPNHKNDFTYSSPINEFQEPSNIIEKIRQVIIKAFKNIVAITMKKEGNILE